MKKKYLFSLVSLLVMLSGFTALGDTFGYGFSYSSWGVSNNYDYTYKRVDNQFTTNITFTGLPTGWSLDSSKTPAKWVRESDGKVVEANIMNFMSTPLMFTSQSAWPSDPFGVWTCVLPQGLFIAGENESEEKTIKLTWVDPNAVIQQRPEFKVTKVSFFNVANSFENLEGQPKGVPVTMMYTLWKTVDGGMDIMDWETNPKSIANLNDNKGFVFNTTWDEYITCFIAEVQPKAGGTIDVWNQETVQEVVGSGTYCKNYVGTSATNCEAYQHPLLGCGGNADTREYEAGTVYTFDIWFYDSLTKRGMDDSKDHNLAIGKYHFEFTGATLPFEYSEIAKLVSVSPVPVNAAALGLTDETAGTVRGLSGAIKFTWSAPVTMTAKYALGGGAGEANCQSCTSSENGTVWTVVPGSAVVSNGEGGYLDIITFNVQAKDEDGKYVKGNAGIKSQTHFTPEFNFDINVGVDEIGASKTCVNGLGNAIEVGGLNAGAEVNVFAIDGRNVGNAVAVDSTVTINNVVSGTYLIVVTDNGVKETVKYLQK